MSLPTRCSYCVDVNWTPAVCHSSGFPLGTYRWTRYCVFRRPQESGGEMGHLFPVAVVTNRRLQITKIYSLTVLKPRSLKARFQPAHTPCRGSRGRPHPASGGRRYSSACGHVTEICLLVTWPSPLCLFQIPLTFPIEGHLSLDLRPIWIIQDDLLT